MAKVQIIIHSKGENYVFFSPSLVRSADWRDSKNLWTYVNITTKQNKTTKKRTNLLIFHTNIEGATKVSLRFVVWICPDKLFR